MNFDSIFKIASVVIVKFVWSDVIYKNSRVTKYHPFLLEHPVHILNKVYFQTVFKQTYYFDQFTFLKLYAL